MNNKKNKILIITLIAITLVVIFYIVYLFMGKKPTTSNESGGVFSGFSSLLSRKKTTPGGSQINPDGTPVDIGADTDIPDTDIDTLNPGNPGTVNPGGVGVSEPGTPGFNPLPSPGNNGTVINPNDPEETPEDITKIDDPTDTTKKKPCGAGLPKGVLDIICEQGGLTPYGQNVNVVGFSLNDEEQAELDRLSRMFARLAPYLKTEADVAREQSNQESYEAVDLKNNSLARGMDIDRKRPGYAGPVEVVRPFLGTSFMARMQDSVLTYVRGYDEYQISLTDGDGIIGKALNNLMDGLKAAGDRVGTTLMNKLIEFIRLKASETILTPGVTPSNEALRKCQISRDSGSGSMKMNETCGFDLFEKTLNIY